MSDLEYIIILELINKINNALDKLDNKIDLYLSSLDFISVDIKTIDKLKQILYKPKCDHKIEILKEINIKHAHIYCKIKNISGPVSGILIEYYIRTKYGMIKNNASECIGDVCYNQTNIEIKISSGGVDHNKFNYVQLRMNHNCNYILTAYYMNYNNIDIGGELFIFKLNKKEMKKLIFEYGAYAHGAILNLGEITNNDLNDPTNNKEYCIRPIYGGKCLFELLKFRIYKI